MLTFNISKDQMVLGKGFANHVAFNQEAPVARFLTEIVNDKKEITVEPEREAGCLLGRIKPFLNLTEGLINVCYTISSIFISSGVASYLAYKAYQYTFSVGCSVVCIVGAGVFLYTLFCDFKVSAIDLIVSPLFHPVSRVLQEEVEAKLADGCPELNHERYRRLQEKVQLIDHFLLNRTLPPHVNSSSNLSVTSRWALEQRLILNQEVETCSAVARNYFLTTIKLYERSLPARPEYVAHASNP